MKFHCSNYKETGWQKKLPSITDEGFFILRAEIFNKRSEMNQAY